MLCARDGARRLQGVRWLQARTLLFLRVSENTLEGPQEGVQGNGGDRVGRRRVASGLAISTFVDTIPIYQTT